MALKKDMALKTFRFLTHYAALLGIELTESNFISFYENIPCAYCDETLHYENKGLHIDHIKPKSLFPELRNEITNLIPACEKCNLIKQDCDSHAACYFAAFKNVTSVLSDSEIARRTNKALTKQAFIEKAKNSIGAKVKDNQNFLTLLTAKYGQNSSVVREITRIKNR